MRYRQGRGEFEALVVAVNEAKGVVRLKRLSDGKRVARPLSKVYG